MKPDQKFKKNIDTPDFIKKIIVSANKEGEIVSNEHLFKEKWNKYLETVKKKLPDVTIENNGDTLYSGDLSKGCRACKDGAWDCLFITFSCNLTCSFCCSPYSADKNQEWSAFGSDVNEIIRNYSKTDLSGISFSGGEALLQKKRLFSCLSKIKNKFPEKYYWLYTNGILADKNNLEILRNLGINEIRFNLAATDFENRDVLKNLEEAGKTIENVTVEIPAVSRSGEKILSNLKVWSNLGVKYLNLHELMREENSLSENLSGNFNRLILKDGHITDICCDSRKLSLKIMEKVETENLPLSVNFCSLHSKILQVKNRRELISSIQLAGYEKFRDGVYIETICAFKNREEYYMINPDEYFNFKVDFPEFKFVKLKRVAPLSLNENQPWSIIEEI